MASARKKVAASTPEDNEAYWHGNGFTPFNFNDDEEDDSIDVIRWDGSNAASVKPKAQSSTHVRPVSQPISARPASARYTPRKPNFPPSPASLPNTEVRPKPDTRTIAEVVNEKTPPTATELVKLETEIQTLRRKLAQAKRDQAAAPSKSETLRRIMVSEPYVLELYKSKEDKASLLDSAIERQDGNAILAATLFMRDTLKRDIFSKELMQRQVAVDHYCAYLRAAGEIDELHETLSALGRTEEAAMLKYKQCLASTTATTPEIRASGLKDCVKYYFDCDIRLTNDTQAIQEQISLMQRQSVVEDGDKAAEASGNIPVFKSHPRKESIIYKSLVTTLYYFCYYHWGETEGILSSPTSLRNEHKIGEKQFMFISVAALCKMRSSRLHAVIGFDKVVDVLSKNLAPADALAKYCAEIENTDKRLEWAMRLKCYKVTIDTLTHMRDRAQLVIYLDQIPTSNQHMRQYLNNQIRSQDIKWRN